jgi:hypothetical protein
MLNSKPCKNQGELSIAFYKGADNEPLINRATQWWTGDYVHCELVFVDPDTGKNLSCGIWQGETVFLRAKTFGRDTWAWKTLSMTTAQIKTIKTFCASQADGTKGFNKSGLIRCTSPFPKATDGESWFCSELCVNALQKAGFCTELEGCMTTPTALYDYLSKEHGAVLSGSVMLDQRIKKKGLSFIRSSKTDGGHSPDQDKTVRNKRQLQKDYRSFRS